MCVQSHRQRIKTSPHVHKWLPFVQIRLLDHRVKLCINLGTYAHVPRFRQNFSTTTLSSVARRLRGWGTLIRLGHPLAARIAFHTACRTPPIAYVLKLAPPSGDHFPNDAINPIIPLWYRSHRSNTPHIPDFGNTIRPISRITRSTVSVTNPHGSQLAEHPRLHSRYFCFMS